MCSTTMTLVACPGFNVTGLNSSRSSLAHVGEVMPIDCRDDYVEVETNISSVTCLADGNWTDFPNCLG